MKRRYFSRRVLTSLSGLVLLLGMLMISSCSEDVPEIIEEQTEDVVEEPAETEEVSEIQNEVETPIGRSRDISLTAEQQKIMDATIATSYKLFRIQNEIEIRKQNGEYDDIKEFLLDDKFYDTSFRNNIISSPLGMMWPMIMLANATDGNSRREIMEGMGYKDFSLSEINDFFCCLGKELCSLDPISEFNVANSVWLRHIRNRM